MGVTTKPTASAGSQTARMRLREIDRRIEGRFSAAVRAELHFLTQRLQARIDARTPGVGRQVSELLEILDHEWSSERGMLRALDCLSRRLDAVPVLPVSVAEAAQSTAG